jgi:diguanylate cyclase (GGDEF)-like protein/PAS domain S-box-containing protein
MKDSSMDHNASESKKTSFIPPASYWSMEVGADGNLIVYHFSPLIELIVGFKPDYFNAGLKQWLGVVHPEDRQKVFDFLSRLMRTEGEALLEYRIIRPDGLVRWVSDCVSSVRLSDDGMRLDGSISDISDRKQAEDLLKRSNQQLSSWISELHQRKNKIELLENISKALQPCTKLEEVYEALASYAEEIFASQPGALYLYDVYSGDLKRVVSWANFDAEFRFNADACFAWQSGKVHLSPGSNHKLLCKHDQKHVHEALLYLCAPLVAQGERVGVLYLRRAVNDFEEKEAYDSLEFWKSMATMITERLAFVIQNLKLRQDLLNQSVHDSWTGLHIRHYFEEALQGETRRSKRHQRSIGIILMDIDHLDQVNETMGQIAGNAILQAFGKYILSQIRGSDVACRYGMDEFAILLPEASLEDTAHRAEFLRSEGKKLHISLGDSQLQPLSLSIGVAAFPQQGDNMEALLNAAQHALIMAKEKGRDRVVVAESILK